jgi:CelD/BcsL family acetyltransferase involved in cellulose biosynthesis
MIEADVRRPAALSPEEVEAWRGFCAAEPVWRNPLLGPDFAQLVGEIRDDARVAVFSRGGQPVGFLAFHQRPGGLARPIGTVFSDYHALVAAPGERIDGREALRAAGIKAFRAHGMIDPAGAFEDVAPSGKVGYLIAPGPSPEAYLKNFKATHPKRLRNFNRLRNKLTREYGEIALVADDASPDALELLLQWKRDQFHRTGLHDVLRPHWARALMDAVFARREAPLRGRMITLRAGGRVVAGQFGPEANRIMHGWISSIDPACASAGPGTVLMLRLAEAMQEGGIEVCDMGPGHDHYKAPFATDRIPIGEGLARAWRPANALHMPACQHGFVTRLRSRLDHIAAAELSMGGRMRGWMDAVAGYSRRVHTRQDDGPSPADA